MSELYNIRCKKIRINVSLVSFARKLVVRRRIVRSMLNGSSKRVNFSILFVLRLIWLVY